MVEIRHRKLTAPETVAMRIRMARDLYHHLRSGHKHTEDEAVTCVLKDLARGLGHDVSEVEKWLAAPGGVVAVLPDPKETTQ